MSETNQESGLAERYGREAVHSIRNYMAIAAGAVRLARDASNQCELHHYLDAAEGAIRRGGTITDSLTKLAATRASTMEFDANETIRLLEPLFEAMAGRQVTVELELHCSTPRVHACQAAFEAALLELVANARDAIAGRGRIRIRSVGIGGRLVIMVADTGTGMAEASRICGGSGSISTKANGTGTGLPQVRGFADQSQGRLHIRSVSGHGTVIALNLPAEFKTTPPDLHLRHDLVALAPDNMEHEKRPPIAA